MNGGDPAVQRRRPVAAPLQGIVKVEARMPSGATTRSMFERDGWRCRFCDCRVVPPKARSAMRAALPGAVPWSEAEGFHGAFYALSASVDHIVPHSAGGTNEEANIVTACWSCQFGRGAWSLEEVGLSDPRARAPIRDDWDGLTRLLSKALTSPMVAASRVGVAETTAELREVPPPAPRRSKLGECEWFAALDAIQEKPSARLVKFVESCSELGVSWSLNKVLLIKLTVGHRTLDVIGVEADGSCAIPWSIGSAKEAFKAFAETLAASIPGAIVYETPKMWVVAKPPKERVNVLELLEAAPTLDMALATLRSRLLETEQPKKE